jgi:hypothetical protein
MSPTDQMAFFDVPPFVEFLPEFDEVHISCTFTWDKEKAEFLHEQWSAITNKPVRIGGPAYNSPCGSFTPGMYVKKGVVFTSRGCVNHCPFCFVPKREGKLIELPICEGNIIQDNNFLACSKQHKQKVYDMLKTQHVISFRGGLESEFINDWDIEQMKNLRIQSLWMACDSGDRINPFIKAVEKLKKAGFTRNKIYCYALIGDDMKENEERLRLIYKAGALPFAQLFQPPERIEYSQKWKQFQRQWSRPAIIKARMKKRVVSK